MSLFVNDLTFSYAKGSAPVLNIPRWEVSAGERVFVQGASGSGKSTLLNVLCGTLPAQSGEVSVLGTNLNALSARKRDRFRANHIGYVFQQFNLIPYLNVIENVQLGGQFSTRTPAPRSEIEHLLQRLNIDTQLWRRAAKALSIGQQQRVAIARALINRPELLVVDEPTSSLDHKNRDDFMQLLMELLEDTPTTLIFVSHDASLATYFQRIDSMTQLNSLASPAEEPACS